MEVVQWEKKESVAVINMCNGANRQNLEFATQMHRCFDEILEDEKIFSIVLTSTDVKNFSQGIDIEWLGQRMNDQDFDAIKTFMYEMNKIFKRILFMPMPVIAAINGHAAGNGAMLACTCDFRFMQADKGFFFFPEVDINIPFLPGMIEFVRKAIPEHKFNEMILTGKKTVAQELEDAHVIVKACENRDVLLKEALEFAKTFSKKRPIFGELKKRMYQHIVQVMETQDAKLIEALDLYR